MIVLYVERVSSDECPSSREGVACTASNLASGPGAKRKVSASRGYGVTDGTGHLNQQSMGHFCKRARNSGSSEGHQAAGSRDAFLGDGNAVIEFSKRGTLHADCY